MSAATSRFFCGLPSSFFSSSARQLILPHGNRVAGVVQLDRLVVEIDPHDLVHAERLRHAVDLQRDLVLGDLLDAAPSWRPAGRGAGPGRAGPRRSPAPQRQAGQRRQSGNSENRRNMQHSSVYSGRRGRQRYFVGAAAAVLRLDGNRFLAVAASALGGGPPGAGGLSSRAFRPSGGSPRAFWTFLSSVSYCDFHFSLDRSCCRGSSSTFTSWTPGAASRSSSRRP